MGVSQGEKLFAPSPAVISSISSRTCPPWGFGKPVRSKVAMEDGCNAWFDLASSAFAAGKELGLLQENAKFHGI